MMKVLIGNVILAGAGAWLCFGVEDFVAQAVGAIMLGWAIGGSIIAAVMTAIFGWEW